MRAWQNFFFWKYPFYKINKSIKQIFYLRFDFVHNSESTFSSESTSLSSESTSLCSESTSLSSESTLYTVPKAESNFFPTKEM